MVYAFLNDGNPVLHFHERNYGFFNIKLNSETGSCSMPNRQQRVFAVHGWMQWFAWTAIAVF